MHNVSSLLIQALVCYYRSRDDSPTALWRRIHRKRIKPAACLFRCKIVKVCIETPTKWRAMADWLLIQVTFHPNSIGTVIGSFFSMVFD